MAESQTTPRQRGPNWTSIAVLVGVGIGLIIVGLLPPVRAALSPSIEGRLDDSLSREAVDAMRGWRFMPGVEMEGEPELVRVDENTLELTAIYVAPGYVDKSELEPFCDLIDPPGEWQVAYCGKDAGRSNVYRIRLTYGQ